MLGFGAFVKGSHATASPLHVRGNPLWGHPAQTQPWRHGEGAPKPEFPGQPGLEAALIPGRSRRSVLTAAALPCRGILTGSVFTAPETRGVLNTQLLKGWPCPCVASSSVTPARHPQPGTLGEGERLHTQFFFKRSHQENKKKTQENSQKPTQSDGTASVLGVPSKTFCVGPPRHAPVTAPAMKVKLGFYL